MEEPSTPPGAPPIAEDSSTVCRSLQSWQMVTPCCAKRNLKHPPVHMVPLLLQISSMQLLQCMLGSWSSDDLSMNSAMSLYSSHCGQINRSSSKSARWAELSASSLDNDSFSSLHNMQVYLRLPWVQMAVPAQSTQNRLCLSCLQNAEPLQSLQAFILCLCGHVCAPPHSLQ